MLRRGTLTQLRKSVHMRGTTRYWSTHESTYRPKPSQRGSYAQAAAAAARQTASDKTHTISTTRATTETPHLAWIGLAGTVSAIVLCAAWSGADETRRAQVEELINSEDNGI